MEFTVWWEKHIVEILHLLITRVGGEAWQDRSQETALEG